MDFIKRMHLPLQLAAVDPIVASFCGGAVGVLSALIVVEINNAKAQEKRRCQYCEVRGIIVCACFKCYYDDGRAQREAFFIDERVCCSGSSAGVVRKACAGLESLCAHAAVEAVRSMRSGRCMLNAIFVVLASDSSCRSKQAPIQIASCGMAQ